MESKARIYKTWIRPIMTYAIQRKTGNSITKRPTVTTDMKCNRWQDHIIEYTIRKMCGFRDAIRCDRQRRCEWNNHGSRIEVNRLARIARDGIVVKYEGLPEEIQPGGRIIENSPRKMLLIQAITP